jgi:hypothetical protein
VNRWGERVLATTPAGELYLAKNELWLRTADDYELLVAFERGNDKVAISADHSHVLAYDDRGGRAPEVWRLADRTRFVVPHELFATDIEGELSPDGRLLLLKGYFTAQSGSDTTSFALVEVETGTRLIEESGPEEAHVRFTADGRGLHYTTGRKWPARRWHIAKRVWRQELPGGAPPERPPAPPSTPGPAVVRRAVSSRHEQVLAKTAEGEIYVANNELRRRTDHDDTLLITLKRGHDRVILSDDCTHAASFSWMSVGPWEVWRLADRTKFDVTHTLLATEQEGELSPDGRYVLVQGYYSAQSGSDSACFALVDVATDTTLFRERGGESDRASFTADGQAVRFYGGRGRSSSLWHIPTRAWADALPAGSRPRPHSAVKVPRRAPKPKPKPKARAKAKPAARPRSDLSGKRITSRDGSHTAVFDHMSPGPWEVTRHADGETFTVMSKMHATRQDGELSPDGRYALVKGVYEAQSGSDTIGFALVEIATNTTLVGGGGTEDDEVALTEDGSAVRHHRGRLGVDRWWHIAAGEWVDHAPGEAPPPTEVSASATSRTHAVHARGRKLHIVDFERGTVSVVDVAPELERVIGHPPGPFRVDAVRLEDQHVVVRVQVEGSPAELTMPLVTGARRG